MPDPADIAQRNMEEEERIRDLNRSRAQPVQLRSKGECHNCEEPLKPSLLFCDADCRDDWEKRLKSRSRR